jgi:hypothetical protein
VHSYLFADIFPSISLCRYPSADFLQWTTLLPSYVDWSHLVDWATLLHGLGRSLRGLGHSPAWTGPHLVDWATPLGLGHTSCSSGLGHLPERLPPARRRCVHIDGPCNVSRPGRGNSQKRRMRKGLMPNRGSRPLVGIVGVIGGVFVSGATCCQARTRHHRHHPSVKIR